MNNIKEIERILKIYGIDIKTSTDEYKDINIVFSEIAIKFNNMECNMPFFLYKLNKRFICKTLAGIYKEKKNEW